MSWSIFKPLVTAVRFSVLCVQIVKACPPVSKMGQNHEMEEPTITNTLFPLEMDHFDIYSSSKPCNVAR